MSFLSVKEALNKILSKSDKASDVFKKVHPDHLDDLRDALSHLAKKCMKKEEKLAKPGANAAATSIMNAFGGGGSSSPPPAAPAAPASGSLGSNITAGLNSMMGKEECYKISDKGQWSIEKGDGIIKPKNPPKPGPALNYKEMNAKPDIKPGKPLDYSKPKSNIKPGPSIDYSAQPKGNKWAMSPEEHQAAFKRISANRQKIAEKYGAQALNKPKSEPKGVNKDEGVLEDKELSPDKKSRMMAKQLPGEQPVGSSMAMSEAEPHKDDPHHEAKEKAKAKKIKEEAEGILEMHKEAESGVSNDVATSPADPLSKPPVSEAQRKAMHAAAAGKSNLDIPKSVGKDFSESDPGGKLPEKAKKADIANGNVSDMAMSEVCKTNEHGQWSLEKAKFITPEQQKANRSKIKENDNKVAARAANIHPKFPKKPEPEAPKEKPFGSEMGGVFFPQKGEPIEDKSKDPPKKKHLTVIKEEAKS